MKREETHDAYLKQVQTSFRHYCYFVHNYGKGVDDKLSWIPSPFHKYLSDTAQEFVEGDTDKAFEILVLNTPPQVGKSTTITETYPSFHMGRHPEDKVITISYGDDLAERFGKRNLEKVKEFGYIFGSGLNPKKSTAREFELSNGKGRAISKGFGSGITGHSGDLIIIDDPVKNHKEADSQTYRDAIWNEFDFTVKSRTSAGAKIIVIMTRWHEDDLAGRIIKEYPDRTTVINLPCECEEPDVLGRKPKGMNGDERVGDALCPQIGKDNDWLADFKSTYTSEEGLRAWNALYQGRPTAMEGNILKRDWWEYYEVSDYEEGRLVFDQMIMSVDAAFKDGAKNDRVAIEVWGKKDNRIYLVDLINEHLNFKATINKIMMMKLRHSRVGAILIEDKANGSAIIQVLKSEIMGIIAVSPDASKEARVNAVSPYIEAGNVYLPKDKKFTWEFVDQCAKFPNDSHDDMVDSMSQALSRLVFSRALKRLQKKARRGDSFFSDIVMKKPKSGLGEKINVI